MDQEKLARLPKWAQQEIENNQRTIERLKSHIAELNQKHPDSNVQLGNYVYGDYGLPPDSEVGFYLHEPPYQKFRNQISVQPYRSKNRATLSITAHSGHLVITPRSSNGIELSVRDF